MNDNMMPDRIQNMRDLEKVIGGEKVIIVHEEAGSMAVRIPLFFEESNLTKIERFMRPLQYSLLGNEETIAELKPLICELRDFTEARRKDAEKDAKYADTRFTKTQVTFWTREAHRYKRIWEIFEKMTKPKTGKTPEK